jgi:Mce-associated membrane protein
MLIGVVTIFALLGAALAAVAAVRVSHRHALDSARDDALAAATTSVAKVLSYDYRHLGRDFQRAEAQLTPRFRRQYGKATANGVEPLAAKYRATSTAVVPEGGAGAVSVSTDRVVVLVFVDQTVTNSQLSAPRLDRSRMNVTMVHQGGRWLIDALRPF